MGPILRIAVAAVVALVAVASAGWLGLYAAAWTAGPNISDVGVPLYAGGHLGVLAGLAVYVAAAAAFLIVGERVAGGDPRGWKIGIGVAAAGLLLLAAVLVVTYG